MVQKNSRIKGYVMHWLALFFNMEAKFGPLKKLLMSIEMKFFGKTSGYTLLDHKRNEEILEELKVVSADEKLS